MANADDDSKLHAAAIEPRFWIENLLAPLRVYQDSTRALQAIRVKAL
ncbi:hypothetical protein OAF56_01200 [Pirellulaceae bacterium]|nr:hypothetical protein [Pirellulaceae bacterium]MDB4640225.1 hypothetical protein [Pirellulaceae bacterium]